MRSALRLAFIAISGCVYTGLAILGWGGLRPFFSHAALIALALALFALSVVAFFAGGNLSPGVREVRGNRWVIAVFAVIGFLNAYLSGVHRQERTVDTRRRRYSLAGCRAVCCRWCVTDMASLCFRPPIQRPGRDPAGPFFDDQWCLRSYPAPELSWPVDQLTGMEPGFSFWSRRNSHDLAYSPCACTHQRRRELVA